MIEGWRGSRPDDDDRVEWPEQERACDVVETVPAGLALWSSLLVATVMAVWAITAIWLIVRSVDRVTQPVELLIAVGAATAPLALGVLILLAIRQSNAVARRRLASSHAHVGTLTDRLERAAAAFARRVRDSSEDLEARAGRWTVLSADLVARTTGLAEDLEGGLALLDDRLTRLDGAAASARRDLAAVLVGLPKADRQTRDLAGSLRDAGLTAHEGAKALDAQLGLLRHRANEAEEMLTAAANRLAAQLARVDDVGEASGARLSAVVDDAGSALDQLVGHADALVDKSAERLTARAAALRTTLEVADRALVEADEQASARLAARLDLLDDRLRAVADRLSGGDAQMEKQVHALDGRVAELGRALAEITAGATRQLDQFDGGLLRLDERATGLSERIGAGDEAMAFALGRAESLLGALDAAARELDETLPASFGRFERSAGEGFERLANCLPDLERYHALSDETANRLAAASESIDVGANGLTALGGSIDGRLAEASVRLATLAEQLERVSATIDSLQDERTPQLTDRFAELGREADGIGLRAIESVDEAAPAVRARLVEAVTTPVSDAVERVAKDRMAQAAAVASDSVLQVERASEQLRGELVRIEEVGRQLAERSDSVLAMVTQESEAGFSRRVALLIEALNSTAIDVAKVLSNDVSDTAWAAYLKGDRGVFTRRAVRLLDSGEAREIARTYDDDGEFRGQVNRFVHDFEALLRTVLADANGSPMAVTLLSSDTGKLYVALAQSIERLRD